MERPQLTAQRTFDIHRDEIVALDIEGRFDYIYRNNLWRSEESRSGPGSTTESTYVLRYRLTELVERHNIQSILDIPCGDFNWMRETHFPLSVEYIGADIVPELVVANKAQFPWIRFEHLDIIDDTLPKVDLVFCRDCLVHLSYENIGLAFANIKRSGAKYLMTTTFPVTDNNRNIEDGDWRPLNFEHHPFCLQPPIDGIVEQCLEGDGAYIDKTMALWLVEDL